MAFVCSALASHIFLIVNTALSWYFRSHYKSYIQVFVIWLLLSIINFNTLVVASRAHNYTSRTSSVKQRTQTVSLSSRTTSTINDKYFLTSNENKIDNPQFVSPTLFWEWIRKWKCLPSISNEIRPKSPWIVDESQVSTLNDSRKQLHIRYRERSRSWLSAHTSAKTSDSKLRSNPFWPRRI